MISLSDPVLGEEEKEALCAVIDSGWVTMGDRVAAFEKSFAALHGAEEAVAVNSCTAGLHLSLAALALGPGDEVLVPSLSFVATSNAVLYVGATPVFVDIEDTTKPNISIHDAETKISHKTKAVVVMHYGGYLVDLPAWRSLADSKGLALIEDAAHAPGMAGVGKWSDAAAFSFFTNKNMTTAEGGMVIAREKELLQRVRRMRSHGMTTVTLERHRGRAFSYDVTMLGYNYRMDELRAAMGLVQLERLPKWTARRQELNRYYRKRLAESLPDVTVPFEPAHPTAAHVMAVLLPRGTNREKVMAGLRQNGVQTSIHFPPIHHFTYYRQRFPGISLPNTEAFFQRALSLPLHPSMREEDVETVVDALKRALLS